MIIMNRNTSPLSPFTEADYLAALRITEENQYPEVEMQNFKQIYSQISGLKADEIELANGSDEWIQKLIILFAREGVLTLSPDFFMYQEYAEQFGYTIAKVTCEADFSFSLPRILAAIAEQRPKLFILSNPHNPTGVLFEAEFLDAIASAMAQVNGYFAIDEAYVEFAQDVYRPQAYHIIYLRTLSKIYGMAGLRIGIIQAIPAVLAVLTKINHPYPINSLTLNLATHFLRDKQRLEEFLQYQLACKEALVASFQGVASLINLKPSAANFVFSYGETAMSLGNYLIKQGYQPRIYQEENLREVVRYSIIDLAAYPAFQDHILNWRKLYDNE